MFFSRSACSGCSGDTVRDGYSKTQWLGPAGTSTGHSTRTVAGVTRGQDTREASGPSGQGSSGEAGQRHRGPGSKRPGTWSEAEGEQDGTLLAHKPAVALPKVRAS